MKQIDAPVQDYAPKGSGNSKGTESSSKIGSSEIRPRKKIGSSNIGCKHTNPGLNK